MPSPHIILKKYWNYDGFRENQLEVIEAVLNKKDALAVLPTGAGKSICFQVPAMALPGVCLVVSPLIALMKDQVDSLKKNGIRAIAIHSGLSKKEIDIALDNAIYGDVKFLYVSPERLSSELFLARAKQMKFSFLVIDEAHCISQWGHDFRPAYLEIPEFLKQVPIGPLLALTATATKKVKEDIIKNLGLNEPIIITQSFARTNIELQVIKTEKKEDLILNALKSNEGSAIIYVRSRRRTEQISRILNNSKIKATSYHAGLAFNERELRQSSWLRNEVKVMVATNAFGMGINKADVRIVIHLDLPENLENYYQEAGRAGRDEKKSKAILLYDQLDCEKLEKDIEIKYPKKEFLIKVYQNICDEYQIAFGSIPRENFDFDLLEFSKKWGLKSMETYSAIKILNDQDIIYFNEDYSKKSSVQIKISKRFLEEYQAKNIVEGELIRLMLRVYGGELFSSQVIISENDLARKFNKDSTDIESLLFKLNKNEVIEYHKYNFKPKINIKQSRFDSKNLPLDLKILEQKKQKDLLSIQKMQFYASNNRICRMNLIQDYFDERQLKSCGHCDVCISNKDLATQIIAKLPCQLSDFSKANFDSNPEKISEKIRELLVKELIEFDNSGLLIKKK